MGPLRTVSRGWPPPARIRWARCRWCPRTAADAVRRTRTSWRAVLGEVREREPRPETDDHDGEEDQLRDHTDDEVPVDVGLGPKQERLRDDVRLADDRHAHDDLGEPDLPPVAEEEALRVRGRSQRGIDRTELVQNPVDALREVLVARSEQDERNHEHQEGLDRVRIDHRVRATEYHVSEDECDDSDEDGQLGEREGCGDHLGQTDHDQHDEGEEEKGEHGEEEREGRALVARPHPLRERQGANGAAVSPETLREHDERNHGRDRKDDRVRDHGAGSVERDESRVDDERRGAGHRCSESESNRDRGERNVAERIVGHAPVLPCAPHDEEQNRGHVADNDHPTGDDHV